jgi:hypothetical protein
MPVDRLLTEDEYAESTRRSKRTIQRERAEGRGCPHVQLGGRILYRAADVDRFVESNLRGGLDQTPRRRGRPPKTEPQPPAQRRPAPRRGRLEELAP